jgi:hypothetical protein
MADLFDDLQFQGSDQQKNYEILKELTKGDNVKMLSELSDNEIKELTRLTFLSLLLNQKYRDEKGRLIQIIDIKFFVDTFLQLRVNKDRKRAGEFVQAFGSPRVDNIERSAQRGAGGFRMIR